MITWTITPKRTCCLFIGGSYWSRTVSHLFIRLLLLQVQYIRAWLALRQYYTLLRVVFPCVCMGGLLLNLKSKKEREWWIDRWRDWCDMRTQYVVVTQWSTNNNRWILKILTYSKLEIDLWSSCKTFRNLRWRWRLALTHFLSALSQDAKFCCSSCVTRSESFTELSS